MEQSKLFSLNYADILKGLLMAVITPVLVIIQQSIANGEMTFNWKAIGMAAIAGGVGYLLKNFFTPGSKTSDSPVAK